MLANHDLTTELLIIDQVPLVNDAMESCERARRTIVELKCELHRFESVDLPAFDRWYNSIFGKYLTEIRELSSFVHSREQVLADARKKHWARFFGSTCAIHVEVNVGRAEAAWDDEEAEQAGFRTFEDSSEEEGEYGPEHEDHRFEEDGYFDDEQESFYSEDDESVRRFEDLFVKGSRWDAGGAYRRSYRSREEGTRAGTGAHGPSRDSPGERISESIDRMDSLQSRLKERYRLLVKRLHPDMNSGVTTEEKALWNQVQQAYRERNLEQLDVLLALSEAFTGRLSAETSIHQLRRAAHEIERLIEPLRRRVEAARQRRAWRFSELQDRSALARVIEGEFQRDLSRIRRTLSQIEAQIIRFTRNAS